MCGIGGALALEGEKVARLERVLACMNEIQKHRGPDGEGTWRHARGHVGLAHRRLSIIDIEGGAQPMSGRGGDVITYNGEVYNFVELRDELGREKFATKSDTEVVLEAYRRWGADCVKRLRGMFAFAIWDEERQELFCARDRFGIKPFYYTIANGTLYFASEAKALLPFVPEIATDLEALKDYLAFQFVLRGRTLFEGIHELPAGHVLRASARGGVQVSRYWEVYYTLDWGHTPKYFQERLAELLADSVKLHLRSDVPIGAYVSGGLDSSTVVALAARDASGLVGFNGRFGTSPEYDESPYARRLASHFGFELKEIDIGPGDFADNIRRVIRHLDYPVAGPGSFSQFMVSALASKSRKVVLAGQGGDEVFGGYARYVIAYFEQCLKAAIDGTMRNGNFVVTYESIIPNLTVLRDYKPLLQEFFRDGMFEPMDRRYFRLLNRSPALADEVDWNLLGAYQPYDSFRELFTSKNVGKESYFDLMTHFDFKTLLPALLHVEDRVSMAHGVESRVPLLDHPIVEFAATMPSNVKFQDGALKHVLRESVKTIVPDFVLGRTDKKGFPTPFTDWIAGPLAGFATDVLSTRAALERGILDNRKVVARLASEPRYGRKIWGLLCLELWQQEFHDRAAEWKKLAT